MGNSGRIEASKPGIEDTRDRNHIANLDELLNELISERAWMSRSRMCKANV
jgi:hypothetical protein